MHLAIVEIPASSSVDWCTMFS